MVLFGTPFVLNKKRRNNLPLKFLAEYIVSSFEFLSGFRIPRFKEVTIEEEVEEEIVKNSYMFTVLGIILLGYLLSYWNYRV